MHASVNTKWIQFHFMPKEMTTHTVEDFKFFKNQVMSNLFLPAKNSLEMLLITNSFHTKLKN